MSLGEILGSLPNGNFVRMTDDSVAAYLSKNYLGQSETQRKKRAQRREAFYRNDGDRYMLEDLQVWFTNTTVRQLREKFIEAAKYDNVSRRIVTEVSTLYTRPATRSVGNEKDNERYQKALTFLRFNQLMRNLQYSLNLHGDALLNVRVRLKPDGTHEPAIDIVIPANFSAISHPYDQTYAVGFMVQTGMRLVQGSLNKSAFPAHTVWDRERIFNINSAGSFIEGSTRDHGFPRMPLVLARLDVHKPALLDDTEHEDLINAHRAVWLQNILNLKESKSANKQTAIIGDWGRFATGQAADSEVDIQLPEDTTTQQIDRQIDLKQFRDNADHIVERVAANRGIPPSVLRHEGAASGLEITLRRISIRERRREQELVFREIERELAEVMSMVFAKDIPELSFSTDGWRIDFGEIETPLTDRERLTLFEMERRLGVNNTLDFIRERNPSMTEEEAADLLSRNVAIEIERNELLRPLMAIAGDAPMARQPETPPDE